MENNNNPLPKFIKAPDLEYVKKIMHGAVRTSPFPPNEILKEVFKRWLKNPNPQIFVHGTKGNGKTTALLWLYHHMVDLGLDVQYASARDLVDRGKECMNNRALIAPMLNRFMDAGCLILDDLGAETKSDFFFSDVIYPLINHRLDRDPCMPFVLVSNMNYASLIPWYGEKNPDQAERFVSRLMHRCVEFHFDKPSYRTSIGTMKIT